MLMRLFSRSMVGPDECLEFAEAEAGVEGDCPERAFGEGEGGEQLGGFGGAGDAFAAAADGGKGERQGWVDGDVAAGVGAAVDRSQREEGVADGARGEPLGHECVCEVLEGVGVDGGEAVLAEGGEDALVERLPVAADRRGLVGVARASADDPLLCSGEPLPGCLVERCWL
jgi:hypothetical protein